MTQAEIEQANMEAFDVEFATEQRNEFSALIAELEQAGVGMNKEKLSPKAQAIWNERNALGELGFHNTPEVNYKIMELNIALAKAMLEDVKQAKEDGDEIGLAQSPRLD